MLQYALLHLFGYALSMDDIKAFRVSLIKSPQLTHFSDMRPDH